MSEFFGQVVAWLTDPANWSGSRGVPGLLRAHVGLTVAALAAACVLSLPLAVYLGHRHRGGLLAISVVNIGRALPSFGVIGVMFPITLAFALIRSPLGYWATLVAMVVLAMPPMFVNAYTGVSAADPALVEAARGMGMTESQTLRRVELPLALPLVMAGIRTAAVAVVATVTLGAWVGYNTLGTYIFVGFAQQDDVMVFVGGLAVAILAVLTEVGLGGVERMTAWGPARRRRSAD
ncbi:MAG: ABC transporter permease [Actinobacteria bacterium]|nr:ABC transporter permease [Actinomycetota bacterium]